MNIVLIGIQGSGKGTLVENMQACYKKYDKLKRGKEMLLGQRQDCEMNIEYLESIGMDEIMEYGVELSDYFISKLEQMDHVEVYNKGSKAGIVAFNLKGIFAQDAASYFNKMGISVRTGNHCAKLLHHVINVNETIRASMYLYNTKEEIDRFADVIRDTTIEKCVDSIL